MATTYTQNEIKTARLILPRDLPLAVVSSGRQVKVRISVCRLLYGTTSV